MLTGTTIIHTHTYSHLLTTHLFTLAHFLPPVCTHTSHSYTWAPPCKAAHCPHAHQLSHMETSMHTYKHTHSHTRTIPMHSGTHILYTYPATLLCEQCAQVHYLPPPCQTLIYTHSRDSITYQLVLWGWGLRPGSGPALLGEVREQQEAVQAHSTSPWTQSHSIP